MVKIKETYALSNLIQHGYTPSSPNDLEHSSYSKEDIHIFYNDRSVNIGYRKSIRGSSYITEYINAMLYDRRIADIFYMLENK